MCATLRPDGPSGWGGKRCPCTGLELFTEQLEPAAASGRRLVAPPHLRSSRETALVVGGGQMLYGDNVST